MDEDLREDGLYLTRMTRSSVWTQVCTRAVVIMTNGTEEHKTFYVVIQTQVSRFVQFGLLQDPSDLERQKDTLYHHSAPLAV